MNKSEKGIYRSIARTLYDCGIQTKGDPAAARLIGTIAHALVELDAKYDEKFDLGLMHDIGIWMGLKRDAPKMAEKFGEDLVLDYPEVLASEVKHRDAD